MFVTRQLYDLQLLDWDIQERERSVAELRDLMADDSQRINAEQNLKNIEAKITGLTTPKSQNESSIKCVETQIANIEKRIYSGLVTNPRELEAFEEEKASLLHQHSEMSELLLEVMVELEDLQTEEIKATETYQSINTKREGKLTEYKSKEQTLNKELPTFYDRRDELISAYPPVAMAIYDNIKKSRNGQAVALVERGACQGCRLTLPSLQLQKVRISKDIVQCSSCTRILVIA